MGKVVRQGPATALEPHDAHDARFPPAPPFRPPGDVKPEATSPNPDIEELCRNGTGPVFRELLRLTGGDRARAEDLTQETFVRALRQSEPGRNTELSVGWLVVVARRLFIDQIRRQSRETRTIDKLRLLRTRSVEPDWEAINSADALRLLAVLDDEARAAIVLRYIHDLPVAEIARLLDRSVRATESTIVRARHRLARFAGSPT
jgi:RNA polymerase sigma-70 factor, ECF subfamily